MKLPPTVKACRGIGLEWGLARMPVIWRVILPPVMPFLGGLLRVAEMIDGSDMAPLDEARHGRQLLAPFCGLAITEWIAATGTYWQGQVVAPRYLLASLAMFTASSEMQFALSGDQGLECLAGGGRVAASTAVTPQMLADQQISITPMAEGEAGDTLLLMQPRPGSAVAVSEACWQRLLAYAHRTYVPENEHSRAAAQVLVISITNDASGTLRDKRNDPAPASSPSASI